MIIEVMDAPTLDARAARPSARADPARLRGIDTLALGDRSLGEQLRVASDCRAHHPRAREDFGLIERRWSEEDKRRSYVRLVATALPGEAQAAPIRATRVVGGTLRSDRVAAGAITVAASQGLDLPGAAPKTPEQVAGTDDLRITVCDRARESPASTDLHRSIPDPVRVGSAAVFAAAFDDISHHIDALPPHVRAA